MPAAQVRIAQASRPRSRATLADPQATPPVHAPQQPAAAAAANSPRASASAASEPVVSDPAELWRRIVRRYDTAQASSAASTTATSTQLVPDGGVTFVLRVAEALRDKPIAPTDRCASKPWAGARPAARAPAATPASHPDHGARPPCPPAQHLQGRA